MMTNQMILAIGIIFTILAFLTLYLRFRAEEARLHKFLEFVHSYGYNRYDRYWVTERILPEAVRAGLAHVYLTKHTSGTTTLTFTDHFYRDAVTMSFRLQAWGRDELNPVLLSRLEAPENKQFLIKVKL
jgi:hypothetical protein